AVVRWSEAEGQRQQLQVSPESECKVLGKALALVCFPVMTMEEFAAEPVPRACLWTARWSSLFLHLAVHPKLPVDFMDQQGRRSAAASTASSRGRASGATAAPAATSGSTSTRAFSWLALGCMAPSTWTTDDYVNVQIIRTVNNTELVEVLPSVNYVARATLKGLDSH
ncbi:btb poz domain-containing protein, partial [Lynx pardinus]